VHYRLCRTAPTVYTGNRADSGFTGLGDTGRNAVAVTSKMTVGLRWLRAAWHSGPRQSRTRPGDVTVSVQDTRVALDAQQLEVLTLLEAHSAVLGSSGAPAHRVALEAYVLAALQHAVTAPLMRASLAGTPRSAVSEGLGKLRANQFVLLTDEGFVLSKEGQEALDSAALRDAEWEWHRKGLSEVVRHLHEEWGKMAPGAPQSA
jgi:hypothetical protein